MPVLITDLLLVGPAVWGWLTAGTAAALAVVLAVIAVLLARPRR